MALATSRVEPLTGSPTRLSWGAIFGGTLVSLALWILFISLGLALGLTAVDASRPLGFSKGAGIGGGLWIVITGFISLFVGGWVAARTAGPQDRTSGILHGAVLWGLSTVALVCAVWMGFSSVVSGLAGAGKSAVQAIGAAAPGATQGVSQAASALGINWDDALRPVNQRLRSEGKPAVTANQIQTATQDVLGNAVRTGKLDRNLLVSTIARDTNLSRSDAEDIAGRVETTFNQKKDQVVSQVQLGAAKVADTTGKVFWGIFGALLLDLVSAVLGAVVGVARRREVLTRVEAPVPPLPPVRREVHP